MLSGRSLLPISSVYQLGEQYFVVDGGHRTSVCRYYGCEAIDAHVIEWSQKTIMNEIRFIKVTPVYMAGVLLP